MPELIIGQRNGAVSQAGGVLLTETARAVGLDRELFTALAPWRRPLAVHDPGKIVSDLAVLQELEAAGLIVLADKGYHGADELITPYKGKGKPESQKDANCAHARLRGPGERANAQLKTWRVLHKLGCCPHKAGHLAKAIHVLQDREIQATTTG